MIEPINFIYKVKYHHIGNYFCEEYGCNEEGICRCYQIESLSMGTTDLISIGKEIKDNLDYGDNLEKLRRKSLRAILLNYDFELVYEYIIDRVLRINKVWDSDSWTFEWERSYYGDEVNFVGLKEDIFQKIIEQIEYVNEIIDLEDKIKYLLELENGFVLGRLEGKTCEIREVNIQDIFFGQREHLSKVIEENNEFYLDKNYPSNLPKGVCIFDNGKWRVVDGYHRISTTSNNKVKIFGFV
jgi:hypothetical protein